MRIRVGETGGYPPIVRLGSEGFYAFLGLRKHGPRLRVAVGPGYKTTFQLVRR
jgi:hypothetical protein